MEAHRSLVLTLLLASVSLRCSTDEPLRVTTHALAGCPIDERTRREGRLSLEPLGDFSSARDELGLSASGKLSAPAQTIAFSAELRASGGNYLGYAERTSAPWLPILLWPEATVCSLGQGGADVGYPAAGDGQALGYARDEHTLLLVGGRSSERPAAAEGALTFDAGTGELSVIERPGLQEPRAFSTVTRWGPELLVAGGENPLRSSDRDGVLAPSKTAEVFDPETRRFADTPIELSVERTRHTAVELPNGDTLLVGGRGPFNNALGVLELVSAETRSASIQGLAALHAARLFPAVLKLDDDRLLVAGGSALDGTPLSFFEWLSSDARQHLGELIPSELPARVDRAFVAMPGGSALAVGGCELREPSSSESAALCQSVCRLGCPPASYDAWWLTSDGVIQKLEFDIEAPRPVLFGGADGRPWLSPGTSPDAPLYRFDPWSARFELVPALSRPAPRAGDALTELDAQAFVWVGGSDSPSLFGLRTGVRNRYARDETILSPEARASAPPPSLTPDRVVASSGAARPYLDGALRFTAESDFTVYVAGTSYAAFVLELALANDVSRLPTIVVGTTELSAWPAASGSGVVRREAETVTLESGGKTRSFRVPSGRARVGLRAPKGGRASTIVRLGVRRGLD